MTESNKVMILSFLAVTFYLLSLLLILKSRLEIDELPVYKRKQKTTGGSAGEVARRLQNLMAEMDEDAERAEELSVITGRGLGVGQRLKRGIIVALASQDITPLFIWIMMISGIFTIAVTLVATKAFGPVNGTLLFVALVALMLSTLNILTTRRSLTVEKEVLEMMHLNFFHYTNSTNFEESVKKSLTALNPMTKPYQILQNYLDKIYGLSMNPTVAIQAMKDDFGNIPSMNQYLDTVVKAETLDTSYKKSLAGIPQYYSQVVHQKKEFVMAMTLVYGACLIMELYMIYSVVKVSLFGMGVEMQNDWAPKMYTGAFVVFVVAQLALFYSSMRKPEKRWN